MNDNAVVWEHYISLLLSLSMIVTLELDGSPGEIPGGRLIAGMKTSSPSRARLSSITVKFTQASVSPAANDAVSVSITKSSPVARTGGE